MADSAPRRSPAWHRDEIILALDLYVRTGSLGGGPLAQKTDVAVVDVSRQMNALPIWREGLRADTFRNPAGVALKLANFRAIEHALAVERRSPHAEGMPRGMASFSVLDRVVFEEFEGRWDALRWEAQAIWSSAGFRGDEVVADGRGAYDAATDAPVDGGGVSEYEASAGLAGGRSRAESGLVADYASYMTGRGHM